jgi:hypothetical protein
MTTREKAQSKAKEIGHCPCLLTAQCPCKYYIDKDICHCAGEKHPDHSTLEWADYNK